LKETPRIKKMKIPGLDFTDASKLILENVGEQFIRIIEADYNLISETNEMFVHNGLQEAIPDYFNTKIDNLLLTLIN
jgi:hypothetical protein